MHPWGKVGDFPATIILRENKLTESRFSYESRCITPGSLEPTVKTLFSKTYASFLKFQRKNTAQMEASLSFCWSHVMTKTLTINQPSCLIMSGESCHNLFTSVYNNIRRLEPLQILMVDGSIQPDSIIRRTAEPQDQLASPPSFSSRFISLSLASSCATIRWNSRLLKTRPWLCRDKALQVREHFFLTESLAFLTRNMFFIVFSEKVVVPKSMVAHGSYRHFMAMTKWGRSFSPRDADLVARSWETQPRCQWHLPWKIFYKWQRIHSWVVYIYILCITYV